MIHPRTALLVIALACAGPALAKDDATQADATQATKTPAELVKRYKGCFDTTAERLSYLKVYDLCSKDSQILLFMRAGQEASAATRGAKFKVDPAKKKALEAILLKHKLKPADKPLEGGPNMTQKRAMALFMAPKKMVAHLKTILKPVKDVRALLADLFAFAQKQGRKRSPQLRPIEVKQLKVWKGRATGRLISERKTKTERMKQEEPFCAIREGGQWRYDLVAMQEQMVSSMKKKR